LKLSRIPLIAFSDKVESPLLASSIKPIILLPIAATTHLSPEQLQIARAHELAHFKHRDHWVLVIQHVMEVVLLFHPALWRICHQLDRTRELSCDAMVVEVGVKPDHYAETLVTASELKNATSSLSH
jgi:beta-lactamase regulating signal transducer with metallopeptidase domain